LLEALLPTRKMTISSVYIIFIGAFLKKNLLLFLSFLHQDIYITL
jgi:hypothetical protein